MTDCSNKYDERDIVGMLEFLIDNIYVEFGGVLFQQTVGIPMGTKLLCSTLGRFVSLFL